MRRRETKRLREILDRFQIPQKEAADEYGTHRGYVWGQTLLQVSEYYVPYTLLSEGQMLWRYLRAQTAWDAFGLIMYDKVAALDRGVTIHSSLARKRDRINFSLHCTHPLLSTPLPESIEPLAHGLFTHQVPLDMFIDALKHDTDLLDDIPNFQQQGSSST